jgi:hypothetical protein
MSMTQAWHEDLQEHIRQEDPIDRMAQHLARRIQAEVDLETVAYKSQTKLRLRRLLSCIPAVLEDAQEECGQLVPVCTELLLLCEHLDLLPQQRATEVRGQRDCEQAADHHIRCSPDEQQVLLLLEQEDERLISVLAKLIMRLQAWVPFNDHDTSKRDGVLANHSKVERELADVLVQLVGLLCQPDQEASPQADREAMAHQLAKHLAPPLVPEYAAPPGSCGALIDGLLAWMAGRPTGAQMLADAVMALPDVLQPLQPEQQPGGAS